jgi:hypothetical protein
MAVKPPEAISTREPKSSSRTKLRRWAKNMVGGSSIAASTKPESRDCTSLAPGTASLLDAFTKAEETCRKSYDYAKRSAFPSAVLILEEEEELFGKNPWGHGLTPENQVVLEMPTSKATSRAGRRSANSSRR